MSDNNDYYMYSPPEIKKDPPKCACGINSVMKGAGPEFHSDYCPVRHPEKEETVVLSGKTMREWGGL